MTERVAVLVAAAMAFTASLAAGQVAGPGAGTGNQQTPSGIAASSVANEGVLIAPRSDEAAMASSRDASATGQGYSRSRPRAARRPGRPGSIELSASAVWFAKASLGGSSANLTSNTGGGFTLFDASADLASVVGADARITLELTRFLAVEGGATYDRPQVKFSVSNDAEQAASFTATGEHLSQYVFDGSLLIYTPLSFANGRGRTFLSGGAGYLRQLHEGEIGVETGRVYLGGAGVKYFFSGSGRGLVKSLGVRADARVAFTSSGFRFTDKTRHAVSVGGGLVMAF